MPHGHEAGWAPAEIAAFIDAALLGTPRLPVLETPVLDERGARCRVTGGSSIAAAAFVSTTEEGPINKLTWQTEPAEVGADGMLAAPRPRGAQRGFFFTVTTTDGLQVSSPAVIMPEP